MEKYRSLHIVADSPIVTVYLNRPERLNALSHVFFIEFPKALASLDESPNFSVIVLAGAGKHFCSGIDVDILASGSVVSRSDQPGRTGEKLRRDIKFLQEAVTAIERCRKPVIAAVHGACIGGAIDIITACDIRYCAADAYFSVREVDMAITADLGTLQRLPGIVGYGNAMELSLTGRKFTGSEAKELGLISKVFATKEALEEGVRAVAQGIAEKSPLAVVGTKAVLLRSRDLTTEQGLDYVATWNSGVLLSDDLKEAISAQKQKRKPIFSKL